MSYEQFIENLPRCPCGKYREYISCKGPMCYDCFSNHQDSCHECHPYLEECDNEDCEECNNKSVTNNNEHGAKNDD